MKEKIPSPTPKKPTEELSQMSPREAKHTRKTGLLATPGKVARFMALSAGLHAAGAIAGTEQGRKAVSSLVQPKEGRMGMFLRLQEGDAWNKKLANILEQKGAQEAIDYLDIYLQAEVIKGGVDPKEAEEAKVYLEALGKKLERLYSADSDSHRKVMEAILAEQGEYDETNTETFLSHAFSGRRPRKMVCQGRAQFHLAMAERVFGSNTQARFQYLNKSGEAHLRLLLGFDEFNEATKSYNKVWYALDGQVLKLTPADLEGTVVFEPKQMLASVVGRPMEARTTTLAKGAADPMWGTKTNSVFPMNFPVGVLPTRRHGAPNPKLVEQGLIPPATADAFEVTYLVDHAEDGSSKKEVKKIPAQPSTLRLSAHEIMDAQITGRVSYQHPRWQYFESGNLGFYKKNSQGQEVLAPPQEQLNMLAQEIDLSPLERVPVEVLSLGHVSVDLTKLVARPKKIEFDGVRVVKANIDATWKLESASFEDVEGFNYKMLQGQPLKYLSIGDRSLGAIEFVRGMKLSEVDIMGTSVTDISPLAGQPIESLSLPQTVSDTKPLASLTELDALSFEDCFGMDNVKATRAKFLATGQAIEEMPSCTVNWQTMEIKPKIVKAEN